MLSHLGRLESPILRYREIEAYTAREKRSLMRTGVLVESTACSLCFRGRTLTVRQSSFGWCGIDEEDSFFAQVPLTEDDVRQYTIDVSRFVDLLRQQNEILGDDCGSDFGLISIGQRHVEGVGSADVYLSLANYDPDVFVARCRHLQRPTGTAKVVVLVPRPITLTATARNGFDSAGVVIASLWQAAESGSLAIDWHAAVTSTGTMRDGVLSARNIVYRGRTHTCDLTKSEMDFLSAYLATDEIDVHQLMHPRTGAIWRQRYRRERGPRQTISQFLSRLNRKLALAEPPVPISYSLARRRDAIVREAAENIGSFESAPLTVR